MTTQKVYSFSVDEITDILMKEFKNKGLFSDKDKVKLNFVIREIEIEYGPLSSICDGVDLIVIANGKII